MHIVGKASPVPNGTSYAYGSVGNEREVHENVALHIIKSTCMQHASEVNESRCCCLSYPAVRNAFFSHVTVDSALFILYVAFHSQPLNTSAV